MFGLQKMSPWPLPNISTREVARCVGKTGAWYVKRTRNVLYKEYEDDLYTAIPAISITMPVSGPLNVAMRDVDTKATRTNTEFSVDAKVVKPPQATGTIPAPGVTYADIDFNTVCETNKTVTNGDAAKSSPASTLDEGKSPHLKDQGIISKDHFVPPVSPCPGPRYADKPHQQSLDQLAFDKLRRTKRADPLNALPNGHSRNISDSSDALTLVNSPGGGSRKHSLTALDLASFTHRIEDSCHKSIVANPDLQDAAQDSMRLNSDPANANGVEHQLQVSIDMAYSKMEAYKLAATTLRTEKEALIEKNDIALQRAAGVAQGLRYELDCLKKNNSQSLKKGIVRNDAEKAALRAENTRLCGNINDMGLQLGLLQSSYHFLETEYESEKGEHVQLSESYLRLVRGRIEQLNELQALEKGIATVRHDLGGLAGDCFERMVRLTLALKDQGIDAMDEEYKKICERAPYHVGFDERDIVNWVNEEVEEEDNGKDRAAGGEAANENRSNHVILDQAYDVKAPKSEAGQESPETYNVRRQREIAEAEERLLGPIGIAISADGTVKNVQAAKGQLHPDQFHHALNSSPDAGTIDDNTPSKTGKSKEISGEDWQNGASEIRSVFQRPRPANYELLDLPAAGSSAKGQLVTKDDLRNVLPGLNVNVTIPNDDFGTEETDLNPILNPANAGPKRSGHAHDIPSLSSNKSASSFEADTMEVMPPKGYMAKPSPVPNQWDAYEVAHQDPVISTIKVAAATDVDRNLHPSRDDKAWLQDVLANIAMAKNDHLQSSKASVAYQLESEAEEDLAASSDFEGEDLEDNQDQVFVDDGDYVGNDCNESLVSDAVDTNSDATQLKESVQGIEEEQDPTTSDKTESRPSDLTIAASNNGKSSGFASSKIAISPNPSSGKTNAELGQAERELGNGDILRFDNEARGRDLNHLATAVDEAKSQAGSKTNSDGKEIKTDPFGGLTPTNTSTPSKALNLPHSESFDIVSTPVGLPFIHTQTPSFPAIGSENIASSHAGSHFSPGFAANARAPPPSTEMQTSNPSIKYDHPVGNQASTQQKAPLSAEAAVVPNAPRAVGDELWETSQSSSLIELELGSAGTLTRNKDQSGSNPVAPSIELEEIAAHSQSANVQGTTAAKADDVQNQYGTPTSPKSYSPPQLSNFSFSSEDLGQPGLSSLHDNSSTAICDNSQNTRPAIPRYTQSKTPPVDKKPIEQARPMYPDRNVLEPTLSSAETTKVESKATKPKMNVAAAIALEKKAKEQAETAEEKQREFSKKQREAAARRKKDAGGKGGRA